MSHELHLFERHHIPTQVVAYIGGNSLPLAELTWERIVGMGFVFHDADMPWNITFLPIPRVFWIQFGMARNNERIARLDLIFRDLDPIGIQLREVSFPYRLLERSEARGKLQAVGKAAVCHVDPGA
ncbi:hypothetical protein MAMC_01008 [Methylacidimicrobium cyclopophantes]|uniref:Uncharacterized protein n=1 Tax=Methylacidimicrobium cyclopophantes TaxID=1041766 RepID=A0A5E6MEJ2_9BACT|nr:hypothetical protein MAMC_01008 [Methylacidimicrobium cyclopophantes]